MESAWGLTWQAAAERAKQMATTVTTGSETEGGQESTASETAQGSKWDWLGAAQKAKELAAQLTETTAAKAKEISSQLTEGSKALAEKAQTISKPLSEQAQQKLKEFKLNESMATIEERLNDLNTKIDSEGKQEAISEEELLAFGMTTDYLAFVRSLNYSTFRDFPQDQIALVNEEDNGDDGEEIVEQPAEKSKKPPLTPWQVRHATLLVRTVKEINELRYVLCPRRMNDDQFWAIYFSLARKHLPRKAYDHSTPVPIFANESPPGVQAKALSEVMRSTFQNMNLTALTKGPGFGFSLGDWSSSTAQNVTSTAPRDAKSTAVEHNEVSLQAVTDSPKPVTNSTLGNDPDWMEYLKGASGSGQGSESGDQEIADVDLENYINELNAASGEDENDGDEGTGTEADLGELLAAMSDKGEEDGKAGSSEGELIDLKDAIPHEETQKDDHTKQ